MLEGEQFTHGAFGALRFAKRRAEQAWAKTRSPTPEPDRGSDVLNPLAQKMVVISQHTFFSRPFVQTRAFIMPNILFYLPTLHRGDVELYLESFHVVFELY